MNKITFNSYTITYESHIKIVSQLFFFFHNFVNLS